MRLGFIPIPDNDNRATDAGEPCASCEQQLARQLAEACELNATLTDAYQALLEEVRKFAIQLELIAAVVLRSSCSETGQERLDTLIAEAHRLRLAVTEAMGRNIENAQELRPSNHPALRRRGLLPALLRGLGIFIGVIIGRGSL
jgi:hypothetical protein